MNREQYESLFKSLCEFVERASKKDATEAEIAVLPAVAKILLDNSSAMLARRSAN